MRQVSIRVPDMPLPDLSAVVAEEREETGALILLLAVFQQAGGR